MIRKALSTITTAALAVVLVPSPASAASSEARQCERLIAKRSAAPVQQTTPWLIMDDEAGRWSGSYTWGFDPASRVRLLSCAFHDKNADGRQDAATEPSVALTVDHTTGQYGSPWRAALEYPSSVTAGARVCDRTVIRTRSIAGGTTETSTSPLACYTVSRQWNGQPA